MGPPITSMNKATKHRILIGRLAIIALTAGGVAAGYELGCVLALLHASQRLERMSEDSTAHDNNALAEARNVLHSMQGSPSGFCSDTEIANFRTLVFRSHYVKDAGRIRGGKIQCSATTGRPERVIGPFKADFRQEDGTLAYRNLSPLQVAGLQRAALQLGSAYVVFGMDLPPAPDPIPINLAITMKASGATRLKPTTTGDNPPYMTTEGSGRAGDTLYVTRCSDLDFSCATATVTVSEVLHAQAGVVYLVAFSGGMVGLLCGMGFSFLFSRDRAMIQQLRRAVERGELDVHYQPIVNLATRQIVGAEALARWTDEDGNAIPPDVFVKAAEDHGFLGLITKAVLKHILRDFATTLQNRPGFRISINVGTADLVDPNFLPMIESLLQKAEVRPESLVVEVTERSAANGEVAKETIRDLRRLGHSVHIDDFGSGFSNLDTLLYLWADTIKVDKAFTRLIGTESVAAAILPQIMNIAQSMQLEVVVEGVETVQQADYFSPGEQKIYAQGWLYGRPMPAEAFVSELADSWVPAKKPPEGYGLPASKHYGLHVVSSLAP